MKEYTYSGTIGTAQIYLSVSIEENYVSGHYFYKSQLISIPLLGQLKNGKLLLNSDFYPEDEELERFELIWDSIHPSGTWKKGDKTLTIKLGKPTQTDIYNTKVKNNPFLSEYDDITKIQIGLFKLESLDSVSYTDGVKLRHFKETHTGITFCRIDSGLVAPLLTKGNYFLEAEHISHFLAYVFPTVNPGHSYYNPYEVSLAIRSINETWLTIDAWSSAYYGGAHSETHSYGINFHFPSSKTVDLMDLIQSKEDLEEHSEGDKFSQFVMHYFEFANPDAFDEKNPDNEGCNYADYLSKYGSFRTILLTNEGIYFYFHFPHFRQNCESPEWATIPYEQLKSFIKPEYYKTFASFGN